MLQYVRKSQTTSTCHCTSIFFIFFGSASLGSFACTRVRELVWPLQTRSLSYETFNGNWVNYSWSHELFGSFGSEVLSHQYPINMAVSKNFYLFLLRNAFCLNHIGWENEIVSPSVQILDIGRL